VLQKKLNSLTLFITKQKIAIHFNLEDIIDYFKNASERRIEL
jgi:hypothetical protein